MARVGVLRRGPVGDGMFRQGGLVGVLQFLAGYGSGRCGGQGTARLGVV